MLAYRFERDKFCIAQRFAACKEALGDRFIGRVLPDGAANTDLAPFFERYVTTPHSVVTAHLIDELASRRSQPATKYWNFSGIGWRSAVPRTKRRNAPKEPARGDSFPRSRNVQGAGGRCTANEIVRERVPSGSWCGIERRRRGSKKSQQSKWSSARWKRGSPTCARANLKLRF